MLREDAQCCAELLCHQADGFNTSGGGREEVEAGEGKREQERRGGGEGGREREREREMEQGREMGGPLRLSSPCQLSGL